MPTVQVLPIDCRTPDGCCEAVIALASGMSFNTQLTAGRRKIAC